MSTGGSRLSRLREARGKIAAMRQLEGVHGGNPAYWRKLATGMYEYWMLALSPAVKADALATITRAVSFEANKEHPGLWWSAAKLFIASTNYAGATRLMQQVVMDYPTFEGLPVVMMTQMCIWRRRGQLDHAAQYILCVHGRCAGRARRTALTVTLARPGTCISTSTSRTRRRSCCHRSR